MIAKTFKSLTDNGIRLVLVAFLLLSCAGLARAADMPLAAGSPIAGISFDDRPLLLPVQRNFQMAMLTASSELGRSCGRIESYGWRMAANEQGRVNQIFNNTVDRMRAQGFAVEAKSPTTVSKDVTLFTADREDKHLIFLWSAGEIGLVMVLCETSAPLTDTLVRTGRADAKPSVETGSMGTLSVPKAQVYANTVYPAKAQAEPMRLSRTGRSVSSRFSPVGDWTGTYSCAQGTTGGTLHIDKVQGERFEGIFRFYPTPKTPNLPAGKYYVYGEYDAESQRILINPAKWIQRPANYYNTIMIGSFDSVKKTFSGFFQGVTGCTSFEATYAANGKEIQSDPKPPKKAVKKTAAPKKKKTAKAAAPLVKDVSEPAALPESTGITVGTPSP